MNDMKLIMENWKQFITETRSQAFIDEFMPLLQKWNELQDEYGYQRTGRYDPEGNPYDPPGAGQTIDPSELPDYMKDPDSEELIGYYDTRVSDGPGPRRANYAQSDREVAIERELLQLFQKYADQSFFKNQVTLAHSMSYNAAASGFGSIVLDLEFPDRDDTKISYLSREGQVNSDAVMSCHGYTNRSLPGNAYGMIIDGHVVFASSGDLASQTLRTAHEKIKKKYKQSGLPKRTGPARVHTKNPEMAIKFRKRMHDRRRQRAIKQGDEPEPDLTQEDLNNMVNDVILDGSDVTHSRIEEILVANWKIKAWFCSIHNGMPWPEKYWRKAYEIGIDLPIYEVDMSGNRSGEINLEKYFGEDPGGLESDSEDPGQNDIIRSALGSM